MDLLQRREFAFVGLFIIALPILAAIGVSVYRLPYTVERRFSPELAAAGNQVTVRVIVRNWGMLPGPDAMWADAVARPLEPASPAAFERLRAFRSSVTEAPVPVQLSYELGASHRGEHPVGPFTVFITDPFGMAVGRKRVGGSDRLVVTPSTVPLPHGAVRLATGSGAAQQSRQLGGGGEHDVISRKYQTGDSMRRVNWSATARFGELMVRQDDQQNDQHAVVILDSARSSYVFDGDQHSGSVADGAAPFSPEFEWAVSMAASIGLHLLGEGFHVRVVDSAEGLTHANVVNAGRFPAEGTRFEPNSGDDELLLHAAKSKLIDAYEVDFRSALNHSESSAGDLPPMFAVVGNLSQASALSLAASARFASGAVAVIVVAPPVHRGAAHKGAAHKGAARADAPPPRWAIELRDLLESGGWIAQTVTSDEAPSAVWGSVDGERLVL
jgi:hypothetical protein